jgi:F-type H+-transporting ATPase subunit delta
MSSPAQHVESVMDPRELSLANVYAEALLELLPRDDQAETVAEQLEQIARMTHEVDGFQDLLEAAAMDDEQRLAMVRRVFASCVHGTLMDFLCVLAENDRLGLVRGVARRFRKLLWERQGVVEVVLTTAVEMDTDELDALKAMLAEALDASPVLHTRVDPSLIGGARVQVGDRVFDASVARNLRLLRSALVERGMERIENASATGTPTPSEDENE